MSVPPDFLKLLFTRKSLFFVGHSLLVYDYLLTLSLEVEYVWKARWTIVKGTFLLNRYGNLIGQSFIVLAEVGLLGRSSQKFCQDFNMFATVFAVFSAESIHILVLMRAWAIWGCTHRVAAWLITLYVTYMLIVIGMVAYSASSASFFRFLYLDEIGVCVGVISSNVWLSYLVTLLLDTGMFAMVIYSLRKFVRESRHLYPSALLHLLVRDAVAFYLASVYNNVFTMLCWKWGRTAYRQDPRSLLELGVSFPALSLVGQRLVLNLRGLQTRRYTTRDLSREVDRQMEAMGDTSFWQPVDQWPNDIHDGSPLDLECSWGSGTSGATQTTDLELTEVRRSQEQRGGGGGVLPPITEIYEVVRQDEEGACPVAQNKTA
ncbi:hypothetical protein BS17DRAFT_808385 [Gyrodon lividus]|nr:hypothetical protein BS17DRAFT_808385 [Gyrodon lividus]